MPPVYALVGIIAVLRAVELVVASRNTRALLARGGRESGQGHYLPLVGVHVGWILALLVLVSPETAPSIPWLVLFGLLQGARGWVLATLGSRWTTRIIVVPGERLVSRGPYRFVRHPNYVVAALEIAVVPMVFGAWQLALGALALKLMVLRTRIRAENSALSAARRS